MIPMSQLTWAAIPGFFDLDDPVLDPDQPVTDDLLKKMNHNGKAAAVRCEPIYMGFYRHGDTVGTPASPVDGYNYVRSEVMYVWTIYSNRAPGAGFVSGQAAAPAQASSQAGALYNYPGEWDINDATGVVTLRTTYWTGSTEVVTTDGIVKVWAVCQRKSVNVAN
jgi:hypothetical protein